MGDAVGDFAVHARFRRLPFEALPVAVAKAADCILVERYFAGWQHLDAVNVISRYLVVRRKPPQGVDLVVEEVDADGRICAHREHIDQRTTDREFTVLADLRHAQVTRSGEGVDERIPVDGVALS